MPIPRIYNEEACPLDGYGDLKVRVLANATDAEWNAWMEGNLGVVGCEACKKLNEPPTPRARRSAHRQTAPSDPRRYCADCVAKRELYARSIVLFYGPRLLDEDVSTVEAALALFDDDDKLPSEIVVWLQLLPDTVRTARFNRLVPNLNGSLTTQST